MVASNDHSMKKLGVKLLLFPDIIFIFQEDIACPQKAGRYVYYNVRYC